MLSSMYSVLLPPLLLPSLFPRACIRGQFTIGRMKVNILLAFLLLQNHDYCMASKNEGTIFITNLFQPLDRIFIINATQPAIRFRLWNRMCWHPVCS